jgi:predicted aspartyl protease
MPSNQILIDGSIKGQATQFVVDTGASDTTFDSSVFSRFGVAYSGNEVARIGAAGELTAIKTQIPDLIIGNFTIRSPYQMVSRTHFLPDNQSGLFGEDFFSAFDLDLDLKHNVFNLLQYESCAGEPVYWANNFSEADIMLRQNMLYVTVEVNGVRTVAVLDTGASGTTISWNLARRLGVAKGTPGVVSLGNLRSADMHPQEVYGFVFSEIGVGDEVIKNPFLKIIDLSPIKFNHVSMYRIQDSNQQGYDMLLGVDFIKAHHIYIATQKGKMYFTYNGDGSIFPRPKPPAAPAP